MEKILLFVSNIFEIVEWLSFCYIILNKKINMPKRKGIICLSIVSIIMIRNIIIHGNDYYLFCLLTFFMIYSFFSVNMLDAVKTWILTFAITAVLESCIGCMAGAFSLDISEMRIICAIEYAGIIILFLWIYYFLIGRKLNKKNLLLPKQVWSLLNGILVVIMFMITFFIFMLENETNINIRKVGSVLIFIGGIAIYGMIIAVVYYYNNKENYRIQNEISEKYNEQQKEYFLTLLEKEQDTKQFRHDMIQHLLVMQDITNRAELSRMQEYLGELLQDISCSKHKCYDVGNDVVNTILNYYLSPIKENCVIKVNGYMKNTCTISQNDLCTIFSNIISNAVEAVCKMEEDKREISIDVNQGEQYLNISISNTTIEEIVLRENGLPQTSKKDKENHGFGLQNVKRIIEKYEGSYIVKTKYGRYISEIYLKL